MLTLQRASAGSGKTFTLAKTYISLLITIKEDNGRIRLRSYAELAEPLRHILGVTFTNKATNEMKQRIVEKLSDLALYPSRLKEHERIVADAAAGKCPKPEKLKTPDYLKEFMKEFDVDADTICGLCERSLRLLLLHYGDFNISTIDAFFQSVLRTFAYETDLNDAYQLEIDSDYINSIGVDAMLDKIIRDTSPTNKRWIDMLMTERANNSFNTWNVFGRSNNRKSLYRKLIESASQLDKENFKLIRQKLQKYFEHDIDLYAEYHKFIDLIDAPAKEAYARMSEAAQKLKDAFEAAGFDIKVDGAGHLDSKMNKALGGDYTETFKPFKEGQVAYKYKHKTMPKHPDYPVIQQLFDEWNASVDPWLAALENPSRMLCKLYAENIPFVAILNDVQLNIREYLDSSNTMLLADTNSLLKRIIGQSETPFIYERIGTRLHNYLIDEFQDTSLLQWQNFYPLIANREAEDNRSLIIGDAKQSIYRFRNADPSIITSVVPKAFPDHIPAGDSDNENTNWRSQRRIVEFNNFFFSAAADALDAHLGEKLNEDYNFFAQLYSNVRQPLPKDLKDRFGYVEFNLLPKLSKQKDDDDNDDDDDSNDIPEHYKEIGPRIQDCLRRGYRMRDIAILVRYKSDGDKIVNAIIKYNADLAEDETPIEFVSDESLKVAASGTVVAILALLKSIASGVNLLGFNNETESTENHKVRLSDIRASFDYYTRQYPEMTEDLKVELVLSDPTMICKALDEMLAEMEIVSLPILVEAVISKFISPELRKRDAAYIAAFQDMVLSYSERNPSDINSFLKWWNRQGEKAAITSPANVDAVQIMTIHKSKGLEFPVVIMPNAKIDVAPRGDRYLEKEWVWTDVILPPHIKDQVRLPEVLPIRPVTTLADTELAPVRRRIEQENAMDGINTAYVAFTRAGAELYIYSVGKVNKELSCLNDLSHQILNPDTILGESETMTYSETPDEEGGRQRFTYGQPLTPEEVAKILKPTTTGTMERITDYPVADRCAATVCRESGMESAIINPEEDEERIDPRSEGNMLHALLSVVERSEDLDRALRALRVSGEVTGAQVDDFESILRTAIADAPAEWFDGSSRVMNERSIITGSKALYRPDRMMVHPDGALTIVDYKFGAAKPKYTTQVKDYIRAVRSTGRYTAVRGYLWYPKDLTLQEVIV